MNNKKGALNFLYNTMIGRFILKLLTARWLSKLCGAFLNSRLSKPLITGFIAKNGINLSDYKSLSVLDYITRNMSRKNKLIIVNDDISITRSLFSKFKQSL